MYSRVLNILWLKFTTQKSSTKKSCLFNYNSPLQFRKKKRFTMNWFYIMYAYRSTVWKSAFLLHPDCTYLTRTKILSMLGTGYFLTINSQQEKPMCRSAVNAVRPFFTISKKQKQSLFHSFNPHSTMARSHTTRNRDFLESISFSF